MIPLEDVREGDGWQDIPPLVRVSRTTTPSSSLPPHTSSPGSRETDQPVRLPEEGISQYHHPSLPTPEPPMMTFNPEHPTTRRLPPEDPPKSHIPKSILAPTSRGSSELNACWKRTSPTLTVDTSSWLTRSMRRTFGINSCWLSDWGQESSDDRMDNLPCSARITADQNRVPPRFVLEQVR